MKILEMKPSSSSHKAPSLEIYKATVCALKKRPCDLHTDLLTLQKSNVAIDFPPFIRLDYFPIKALSIGDCLLPRLITRAYLDLHHPSSTMS